MQRHSPQPLKDFKPHDRTKSQAKAMDADSQSRRNKLEGPP
jgi:hypothetical protein